MTPTEGKLVVLDDSNAILMLEGNVYVEQVMHVNQMLKEAIPDWNIIVFGGLEGEVIDLRGHDELAEKARELYERVWSAVEALTT